MGWAKLLTDSLAASFDCFNHQEACAQLITDIIFNFLQTLLSIMQATRFCEPPGEPGEFTNTDEPVNGLRCWGRVWHSVARLIKAAKLIDVAVAVCPEDSKGATTPIMTMSDATNSSAGGIAVLDTEEAHGTNETNLTEAKNGTASHEVLGALAWSVVKEPLSWSM